MKKKCDMHWPRDVHFTTYGGIVMRILLLLFCRSQQDRVDQKVNHPPILMRHSLINAEK